MAKLAAVIRQLQQARARAASEVQKLDAAIGALNGSSGTRRGGARMFSTAARKKIAAAQRARWARVKKSAKVVPIREKRTLSAAGRRKIAAAQRARWSRVRAAKKMA